MSMLQPAGYTDPIRINFRDSSGKIIEGVSEPQIKYNGSLGLRLKVETTQACEIHNTTTCGCSLVHQVVRDGPANLTTKQWAQFMEANFLVSSQTITDTGNSSRAINSNTAVGTIFLLAGTAAAVTVAVTDYKLAGLQSGSSGSISAGTFGAWAGGSASGTIMLAGTITNTSGGGLPYTECGIQAGAATYNFLLTHDSFAAATVSNNGNIAITYTIVNS